MANCVGSRRAPAADGRCSICSRRVPIVSDGTVRAHVPGKGAAGREREGDGRAGVWHRCPRCGNRLLVFAKAASVMHACPADPEKMKRLTMYRPETPSAEEPLQRLARRSA